MYAIKQHYRHQDGKEFTRILKKRYKTIQGAEKTASRSYRWSVLSEDQESYVEYSQACVIEVKS